MSLVVRTRETSGMLMSCRNGSFNWRKKMLNSKPKLNPSEPVYDILNAGPRHRFMIRTSEGPILVHNCVLGLGYAVGANKLQHALETGLVKIKLPLEECQRIVGIYRGSFAAISQLWKECQVAIEAMYKGYDTTVGHGIQLRVWGKERAVEFPNGMKLQYPDLQQSIGDKGWTEYTYQKKRFRSRIYGGALTENLVQGLARIIVAYQMCAIKQELDKVAQRRQDGKIRQVVHMVHDEVIVVVPEEEAEDVKHMMERVMSTPPKWAPDLPVNCEAGVGRTYVEAK